MVEIVKAQYLVSSPNLSLCPLPNRPEYAFIGRSNVGKSSIINMITGKEKLAKTSNTPGKTQLINHFSITSKESAVSPQQEWYLVDLPGFGFAKRSKSTRAKWEQMTAEYIRGRENLQQLFLLVDGRHKPQQIDLAFGKSLYQWQIPYTIIFTKSDKESQKEISRNVKLFSEALSKFQQFLPRMIVTSSVKKKGRHQLLGLIEELNKEWREYSDN